MEDEEEKKREEKKQEKSQKGGCFVKSLMESLSSNQLNRFNYFNLSQTGYGSGHKIYSPGRGKQILVADQGDKNASLYTSFD